MKINCIKGTKDILPEQSHIWQYCELIAAGEAQRWGYEEIRTPVFEATALFARGIGEDTDIVGKEMYSFATAGGDALTLRPEGTAGVARAFIQNGLGNQGGVVRLWYQGAMFRHERPQKGRQRQFHQFGAELFGSPFPEADVELISFAASVLAKFGLQSPVLHINSIGGQQSRAAYKAALQAFLEGRKESLSPDSQRRLETNPLRILDSKHPDDIAALTDAPSLTDYLTEEDAQHYEAVQKGLAALGIEFTPNPRLVRGLDYYNGVVFEFITDRLGAQNAVLSGGRYDGLIEQLGGKSTPAVGFALGMERIILLMEEEGVLPRLDKNLDVFCIALDEEARDQVSSIAADLRAKGFRVEIDLLRRSLKAQMREADRQNAAFAIIIGEEEVQKGILQLKDLRNKEQVVLAPAEVFDYCRQRLLSSVEKKG